MSAVDDVRTDAVEEARAVRDDQQGLGIGREVLLKPNARVEVQVVGRLVEDKERRGAEESARERKPHPPPAAQLSHGLLQQLPVELKTCACVCVCVCVRVRVHVFETCFRPTAEARVLVCVWGVCV